MEQARTQPAPAQALVTTSMPADFAEQLAAATKPAQSAAIVSATPNRPSMPDTPAPAADPETNEQPQTAASTAPTVAPAPVSAPARKPQVMRPLDAQTRPEPKDGAVQPRQPQPTQRAETPVDLRTAFSDIPAAEQPEAVTNGDDALPAPDRPRDTPPVVIRQETVLPSAGQPPVAHQAAERIIAALQSSDSAASSDRAQPARQGDAPGPVRTLHIQLQPADLGTLTVKLSLRDQMLDIKLEAAEHRTARILEADREKLTEILRSAGYALDGVTVQISSPEKPVQTLNAMTGQGGNGQANAGSQSQAGGAQSDAQRGQGSQRGNDDRSFASTNDGGDHAPRRGSADGDVYI
jgi:chemotaxis protein MotD